MNLFVHDQALSIKLVGTVSKEMQLLIKMHYCGFQ